MSEQMDEEATRICRVCGEEKPLDEFRTRGDSGRRRTECKTCLSKYLKKYRSENKQRISDLNRRWRNEHKDELSEYQLNWQRNNRGKCRAYNKKSAQNMTEERRARVNLRSRKYREARKDDVEYIEKEEYGTASPPSDAARKIQLTKKIARRLTLFLN